MKLDNLRQLIKEELTKVLNEDTFHNGETVLHAGQRFTVVKDSGNIGVQVKTDTGKIKMINRSQLKRVVKEVDIYKANYINGIKSIIKKYPELNLQSIVDKALEEKGVSSMEELTNKQAMELNIQIQDAVPSKETTPSKSSINPYDDKPSRGYMGSKYRGD
jgi:hypothetical protein